MLGGGECEGRSPGSGYRFVTDLRQKHWSLDEELVGKLTNANPQEQTGNLGLDQIQIPLSTTGGARLPSHTLLDPADGKSGQSELFTVTVLLRRPERNCTQDCESGVDSASSQSVLGRGLTQHGANKCPVSLR